MELRDPDSKRKERTDSCDEKQGSPFRRRLRKGLVAVAATLALSGLLPLLDEKTASAEQQRTGDVITIPEDSEEDHEGESEESTGPSDETDESSEPGELQDSDEGSGISVPAEDIDEEDQSLDEESSEEESGEPSPPEETEEDDEESGEVGEEAEVSVPPLELDYRDLSLVSALSVPSADTGGRPSRLTLGHQLVWGAHVFSNPAGAVLRGSVGYSNRWPFRRGSFTLNADVTGGNVWFGEHAAPFATFSLGGELQFWRLKMFGLGRISAVANMPSLLYTALAGGLGYSQPIGPVTLRLGALVMGGISYPIADYSFMRFLPGMSLEVDAGHDVSVLAFGIPTFFLAPPDAMQAVDVSTYNLFWQDVNTGIRVNWGDYSGTLFGRFGRLGEAFGVRLSRTIRIQDTAEMEIGFRVAVNHWAEEVGGAWEPAAMVFATGVIGGTRSDSYLSGIYDHPHDGATPEYIADIPTSSDLGPYGYGRSGNPYWDEPINEAKSRIDSADSLESFTQSYSGASEERLIQVARFMGAFLEEVAYANSAFEDLLNVDLGSSEARRIASADLNEIFIWLQRYVRWYNTHSPSEPLPEDLRRGITVCGGIHALIGHFLAENGMRNVLLHSIPVHRGNRGALHVITSGELANGDRIALNYGETFVFPQGTNPDQMFRALSDHFGAPVFHSHTFDSDGRIWAVIRTLEADLADHAWGIPALSLAGYSLFGVGWADLYR